VQLKRSSIFVFCTWPELVGIPSIQRITLRASRLYISVQQLSLHSGLSQHRLCRSPNCSISSKDQSNYLHANPVGFTVVFRSATVASVVAFFRFFPGLVFLHSHFCLFPFADFSAVFLGEILKPVLVHARFLTLNNSVLQSE